MNEDQLTPEQIEQQRQEIWDQLEREDSGEQPAKAEPAEPAQEPATQDSNESAAQPAADAPGAEPAKETPPVDKVAALEQTVTSLMNRLRATEGHIGNLNSTIKSLRERAPSGDAPSAEAMRKAAQDDKAMARLLEDYPELGATFKEVIEGREAAMRAQVEAMLKQSQPELLVTREEVDQMRRELAVEVAHPGWGQRVKTPEFEAWLNAQPREVRLLAGSDDPQDAIRLLDLEKQSRQPASSASVTKTQRLASAAAVQSTRAGSPIRQKPVEEMTKEEYWAYLEAQDRQQARA